MTATRLSRIAGVGVAFFLLAVPLGTLAAFGISPPFLNADHLVAGAKYVQTIFLVQSDADEDISIKAELEVPKKIQTWFEIDKGFSFVIPKGVRQFPVTVTIEVPQNERLGSYQGSLSFTTVPASQGQVTIALGAKVVINLTVGTDVYRKVTVPIVKPLDIEEGWNPRVYVKFNNEGNIPESFTGGTFELLNQYGGTRLAYAQKSGEFPETPPFSVREYAIEFPVDFHLGLGQYWGNVQFFQGDTVVATQKTVFNVLKKGSLSNPLERTMRLLQGNYLSVSAILIIGIIAFWVHKRWRKRGRYAR